MSPPPKSKTSAPAKETEASQKYKTRDDFTSADGALQAAPDDERTADVILEPVADHIPATLRRYPTHWAPWAASWDEKRQKFDKIPRQAHSTARGASTHGAWWSFDEALAGFHVLELSSLHGGGVGFNMTGTSDLIGIDLDRCVSDGVLEPWAREIVDQAASYAEVSPSGHGVRIFVQGSLPQDWNDHERGIEVYAGHTARFLTVTGRRLDGCPDDVQPAPGGFLDWLRATYPPREKTKAESSPMPALPSPGEIPDHHDLDLPYQAGDFLTSGEHRGDRSRELFATAVALFAAGLWEAQVFGLLANNEHAMAVALDHRRQDHDRALAYLWTEHCLKAKARASSKVATADDFEVVEDRKPSADAVAPELRFPYYQAAEFTRAEPVRWAIKGVLPRAETCAIVGESGSGKTFLTLDMLMAIATGLDWRGHKVTQEPVLYICAEGAAGFRLRLRAWAEHHGVDLAGVPFYVVGDAPNLLEKADIKDLLATMKALPETPGVICADTWAQVTAGGNENSGEDMGRALGHCKVIHKATRATVVIVAHTGKDASRGMRGWSGVKGALDAEITVERSDTYRSATVTKMKDGSTEGEEFAFELGGVTLGSDVDGEAITSCVVHHRASVPRNQRKGAATGKWQQLALRVARDLTDLAGATVTTTELIDAAVNQMPVEDGKRDRRREHVLAAVESLVAANRLSVAGGVVNVL